MSDMKTYAPGDAVLYALAKEAGATGYFSILEVNERYDEYEADGGYGIEIYTEFVVRDYGDVAHPTTYRMPGPLRAGIGRIIQDTRTIPVTNPW